MSRTKEFRLQNLKRILSKRVKIVKSWAFDGEPHPYELEPHRLHKFNTNCGCKMCHHYKHIGNSNGKLKHKDKILKLRGEDNGGSTLDNLS